MIYKNEFAKYVSILTENEDVFQYGEEVLTTLWSGYHIAKVELRLDVITSPYTPEGCRVRDTIALSDKVANENNQYSKGFATKEGGTASITFYGGEGFPVWSGEERADLEVISNILFLHCGRYRLMYMIDDSTKRDSMTGLPNSRGYIRQVKEVYKEEKLHLYNAYYINIRRCNHINKKYGRKVGDELMVRYSKALVMFTQEDEIIGRLGGDNFVALIKKDRNDEFLQFLSGTPIIMEIGGKTKEIIVSAVAGVSELENAPNYVEQVLDLTGAALNIAKNVLKQPYVFMTDEIKAHVEQEKRVNANFNRALENHEFKVFYQPKVETHTYRIVGAEALVRWYDKDVVVPPADFLPFIEQNGAICQLDFYMLEQVCKDIAEWISKGVEPVRVSVNFSRKNLIEKNFADNIINTLHKYGLDSRYIEVEITETIDEEEKGMLSDFMKEMKENQIAVAIDDFGTGYSSLNLLRTLPVDVLKLDKSFIDNGNEAESDYVVLSNVIRMAKELNMDVVTEGVENWSQVEFLNDMGCNVVQGFLFDKPIPKVHFEERMQNRKYDVTKVSDYLE